MAFNIMGATFEDEKVVTTADVLTKARTIYVTGDAAGEVKFDGSKDVILNLTVKKSTVSELAGRCSVVTYAESAGSSHKSVSANYSEKCTGNSETATKLKTERKISFAGDVDGETIFDGSEDLKIPIKVKKSESANCDGDGNKISETYETKKNVAAIKKELPPFTFSIGEFENKPCLLVTDNGGKIFRFMGEAVGL